MSFEEVKARLDSENIVVFALSPSRKSKKETEALKTRARLKRGPGMYRNVERPPHPAHMAVRPEGNYERKNTIQAATAKSRGVI